MLLQLASLTQVPRTHSVVKPASPQLATIGSNIYATCTIRVTLKLSANNHHKLVAKQHKNKKTDPKYLKLQSEKSTAVTATKTTSHDQTPQPNALFNQF